MISNAMQALPPGTELVGTLVAAIVAGALWLRKLKPSLAVDDKLAAAATADIGIIERLTKEADRLAAQNGILANQLNELQNQIFRLREENSRLQNEVNSMREENEELRRDLRELTDTLNEMSGQKKGGDQ